MADSLSGRSSRVVETKDQVRLRACRLRRDGLRAGSPSRSSRFGVSRRERRMLDQTISSWNQVTSWLAQIESLKLVYIG
jgi:hypothetical protein